MRILFIATQLPLPPDTGGRIRSLNLLQQLSRDHSVTFLSTVPRNTSESLLRRMEQYCSHFIAIPQKQTDVRNLRYFLKLICNFASSYPFSVAKDYSPALARRIRQALGSSEYDVLVCDYLHASINLRGINSVPKVLFQHNVEAEIFRRYYLQQSNLLARLFWLYQWKKMQRYEARVSRSIDRCVAVSKTDQLTFQRDYGLTNVSAIDTGVDLSYFSAAKAKKLPHRLVFTGSMDWLPNEDAMSWFTREILPKVRQTIPEVSLAIVGRRPGSKIKKLGESDPGILVTGRVEDVRPYLAEGSLFVVPIRIGGGTRIKIFEAMASGIPVVSTTVGAEGLPVQHQHHLLLADSPEDFAQAVITLLRNTGLAAQIAGQAETFVKQNNDWKIVGQQFADICRKAILQRKDSIREN
jgi:sugar transferase (PEP-CTERM/EpsH1 system associated)